MKQLNPADYPHVLSLGDGVGDMLVYSETGTAGTVTQLAVAYNELVDAMFGKQS